MGTTSPYIQPEALLAHSDWLRSLAQSLVFESHAVDDAVQETLLSALRRPPTTDRPVRPWLARVMRNLVGSRARVARRREAREQDRKSDRNEATGADEVTARFEIQQLVASKVSELQEPYRSTVLLRYYDGLSAAAIARRQGIPAATVRSRLRHARDLLRKRLDGVYEGDRQAWAMALMPFLSAKRTMLGASVSLSPTTVWLLTGATVAIVGTLAVRSRLTSPDTLNNPATIGDIQNAGSQWRTRGIATPVSLRTRLAAGSKANGMHASEAGETEELEEVDEPVSRLLLGPEYFGEDIGPRGLATSPDGELFVVDYGNRRLLVTDLNGELVHSSNEIDWLSDLVYYDDLLYATAPAGYVYRIDPTTMTHLRRKVVPDPGESWLVNGIAVDGSGRVHVLSSAASRVVVFDAELNEIGAWRTPALAWMLESGAAERFYLAIRTPDGNYVGEFDLSGGTETPPMVSRGPLIEEEIVDLAFTDKGRLFVGAQYSGVLCFDVDEEVWQFLGTVDIDAPTSTGRPWLERIWVDESTERLFVSQVQPTKSVHVVDLPPWAR